MASKTTFADKSADVVVLGAGAAGLSAALSAALTGASVILVGKTPKPGGAVSYAEGVFGVETQMQRERWIDNDHDDIYLDEMNETRWEANARLIRWFHNQSAATIDWMMAQGLEFDGPQKIEWVGRPSWHIIKGHGGALVKKFYATLQDMKNVEILLETTGKVLTVEDGRVVGAVVENVDGKTLQLRARGGVVVATGGFANNPEMLAEHACLSPPPITIANAQRTGDGINMLLTIGAQTDLMSPVMLTGALDVHTPTPSYDNLLIGIIGLSPQNVWVDKYGRRCANEYIAHDFIYSGNLMRREKFIWSIFDERIKQYNITKGTDTGLGVIIPAMTKVTNFDALWDKATTSGEGAVFKANSVQELATAMGVPLENLNDTLENYNRMCSVNLDDEFGKHHRWLNALDTSGPLYAMRLSYAILTTLGGIKVDTQMRPLDENDNPIPGVYVTGNDVGGLTAADTYVLTTASGTSFGFSVGSGRFAGAQAAAAAQS